VQEAGAKRIRVVTWLGFGRDVADASASLRDNLVSARADVLACLTANLKVALLQTKKKTKKKKKMS